MLTKSSMRNNVNSYKMVKQKLENNKFASEQGESNSVYKTKKELRNNKSIALPDQRVIQPIRRSSRNLCAAANETRKCVAANGTRKCVVKIKNTTKEKICNTAEKNANTIPRSGVQTNTNVYKTSSKKSTSSKTVGQVVDSKHVKNKIMEQGETEKVNSLKRTNKKCIVKVRNLNCNTIDNHKKETYDSGQLGNRKEQSNMVEVNNKNYMLRQKPTDFKNSILDIKITNNDRANFKKLSVKTPKDNVYEFLSLTQNSESDNDPAADVINKLITEGKVKVANRRKGKTNIKRIKTTKIGKKTKRKSPSKKKEAVANKTLKLQHVARLEKSPIALKVTEEKSYSFDNGVNDSDIDVQCRIDEPISTHDKQGTFSNLARRVIMQEADKNRQNKQILLEMAKKFVSTPINQKTVPNRENHLSPISKPTTTIQSPKPWRVIDPKLPAVFDFNRSSGNLPSFSSFHIPRSPKKKINQTKNQHQSLEIDSLCEIMNNNKNETNLERQNSTYESQNCVSIPQNAVKHTSHSLSSFSSNDSNGENKPPPKQSTQKITDENDDIFNLRQLPNPRKTLAHRSPLKAINILEVIVLPPYKSQNCNKTMTEKHVNSETKIKNSLEKTEDLFGFEEDIAVEEIEDSNCRNNVVCDNINLIEKLHKLKKWRPVNNDEPRPEYQPIKEVFDDNFERPKHRCIKQMLCSTFIDSPKPHKKTSPEKVEIVNKQSKKKFEESNIVAEQSNLFKDFEPESTFNKEKSHLTYVRPLRKKRKICNNFLMYQDSEESGEDEEIHILDTSQHKDRNVKKKQKRKDNRENPELKSFIKDFNEMCEEVENYNLNIEKIS